MPDQPPIVFYAGSAVVKYAVVLLAFGYVASWIRGLTRGVV